MLTYVLQQPREGGEGGEGEELHTYHHKTYR